MAEEASGTRCALQEAASSALPPQRLTGFMPTWWSHWLSPVLISGTCACHPFDSGYDFSVAGV